MTAGKVPLETNPMDKMLSVVDVLKSNLNVFPLEIVVV